MNKDKKPTFDIVTLAQALNDFWENDNIEAETRFTDIKPTWDGGLVLYDEDGTTRYKWHPDGKVSMYHAEDWRKR